MFYRPEEGSPLERGSLYDVRAGGYAKDAADRPNGLSRFSGFHSL